MHHDFQQYPEQLHQLLAVAVADVHTEELAVNVADLQIQIFIKPQSQALHHQEEHPVTQTPHTIDQLLHLLARGDIRERLNLRWLDDLDPIQWTTQHMPVDEHHAPEIHLDAAPGVVLQQSAEVALEFVDAQIIGAAIKVTSDTAYSPRRTVDCLTPFALKSEGLQLLCVELIEPFLFFCVHGTIPSAEAPEGHQHTGGCSCLQCCRCQRTPTLLLRETSSQGPKEDPDGFSSSCWLYW